MISNYKKISEILTNASSVVIFTHQFPDYDAIGSSLAWYLALKAQNIPCEIILEDDITSSFKFLPSASSIKKYLPKTDDKTVYLFLDTSTLERASGFSNLNIDLSKKISINVDHHPDNTNFAKYNFVDSDISSVGEFTVKLFNIFGWTITSEMADCLYAAILFDTGNFLNSNVTSSTFTTSAQLIDSGCRTNFIINNMYENFSENDFEALSFALNTLTVNQSDGFAYAYLESKYNENSFSIVSFVRKIKDIHVACLFKVLKDGRVKISLRSKTDFDVSKFSNQYHGGGHKKAAGIILNESLDDSIRIITQSLKTAIKDPQYFDA